MKRTLRNSQVAMWLIVGLVIAWLIILFCFTPAQAETPKWKFYLMGVDVSKFRDAIPGERVEMTLGGLASLGVHIAGHHIAGSLAGVNVTQVGLCEYFDRKNEWASRGGFLFQLGVNTLLVEFNDSYFTKGFTTFTGCQLTTYPIRRPDYGDFHSLDNGNLEYFLYSTWAAHNLWRSNHKPNKDVS